MTNKKKTRLFVLMLMTMSIQFVCAQRVQVVDNDGDPIAYASVMTHDAKYIGVTDLDGILADAKGHKTLTISHVAYQTKTVETASLEDGRVVLDDAGFGLDDIVVMPKPYVYVQTYYRMYYYSDIDGIVYYRVGLTDNTYDRKSKTVSGNTTHTAKAYIGLLKTILGMFGPIFDKQSQIAPTKFEDRLLRFGKDIGLKISDEVDGKRYVTDNKDTLGLITNEKELSQRHLAYNSHKLYRHYTEATGKEKQIAKQEKRDERQKNRQDNDFIIYHVDENGEYLPEDFMMKQVFTSYDKETDGKTEHVIICNQVFSTDRAYVTKEELKKIKKDNKLKLTYDNIQKFEKQNKIPALPEAVQKKLNEIWQKDKDKDDKPASQPTEAQK